MLRDDLEKIVRVILDAGKMAREARNRSEKIRFKAHGDVATAADLAVNTRIIDGLHRLFPDDGILSEETGKEEPGRDRVWVLDPIDGSKHFAIGNPFYGVSLALKHHGKYCLAVVYFPESRELFTAVEGRGAYLNGVKIHCSAQNRLDKALVCIEIPSRHDHPEDLDSGLSKMRAIIEKCLRVRILGVSSMGLCWCAAGRYDAYANLGSFTSAWDTAGGEVICKEAGGILSRTDGMLICGNRSLHDALADLLS